MKLNKLAAAVALAGAALAAPASAEQIYGFANVSVNYLDWTDKAEERSRWNDIGVGYKSDFVYIEAEGGAGFTWGEVYGFFDWENPGRSVNDKPRHQRTATKGIIHVNLGESNWNLYGHVYNFSESGFTDQNRVLGFSYDVNTDWGFWAKPFIGYHNQVDIGSNGGMAGWVAGYNFELGGQKLSVINWHEFEFKRKKEYQGFNMGDTFFPTNGKSTSHNGAVSVWWNATDALTLGLQYRYADHKLGTPDYHDAVIYSVKYNF
ncbi:outer membrane protein OmpK [Gallaecimonas sp. GXIMD4217]|uniref:outer membrane protein OmpK n=1 Tax=Gallaecimonas sp. GXIMD4217 TaxID=3131927 RepID=UPI00311B0A0D